MPRKRITRIVTHDVVTAWEEALGELSFNQYEGQALRGFLEEMGHLIDNRDALDRLRAEFGDDGTTMLPGPSSSQMRPMYSLTKIYFDTYYSALSHLSSVVARFSRIFGGVAYSDNKRFLEWITIRYKSLPSHMNVNQLAFEELEAARKFRALLNHPQQFPVIDWSTASYLGSYDVVHLVLHGPQQRNGGIPPGTTREVVPPFIQADWKMDAPDEVSVTNCLTNVASAVLSEVLAHRRTGAAFVRMENRIDDARRSLNTGGRVISPGSNIAAAPMPTKDDVTARAELQSWFDPKGTSPH